MISENLLTQTATLYPYTGESEQGGASFGTAVTLTKVRVTSNTQLMMTALGEEKNDKKVLYFDIVNSLPAGTTFKADDKIVYDTISYRVREVIPARDESTVHHYRIALVDNA